MAKNKDFSKELSKYANQLKELSNSEVVVGIPQDKNKEHSSTKNNGSSTVAEVGATHEYGVPQAGIAQRSFLRVPLSTNSDKIFKSLEKNLKFSKINTKKALGKLGAMGMSIVLEAFKTEGEGNWKSLSDSTREARKKGGGGAKILSDTGQLKQSITFEVRSI